MIADSRNSKFAWRVTFALAAVVAGVGSARAQQDDGDELEPVSRLPGSGAVVQPLPGQQSYQLNAALTRLAANPRDIGALIEAGNAALSLGDNEAALGFFGRADQLSPNDFRVKSALASALVKNEDPFGAIPLFDAAERAGAHDGSLAGDRGLAYDLVGDNPNAQRYYRQALATAPNDEIVRRLALSLAIAGDRKAAEATLLTQLRRNDPAAWRTRAMMLAILGDTEEAVKIATATMPRDLSDAMVPYLRYMGRLTPAQQAAAANFGHFPRAAQIGRDDPRVARYAALNPRRAVPAAVAFAAKDDDRGKDKRDRSERRRERVRDDGIKDLARPREVIQRSKVPLIPAPATPAPVFAPAPVQAARTFPPVRVAAATLPPVTFARPVEFRAVQAPVPAPSPTPSAVQAGAPVLAVKPAPLALPAPGVGPPFASLSIKPAIVQAGTIPTPAPASILATAAPVSPAFTLLPGSSARSAVSPAVQPAASALDLARRAQQTAGDAVTTAMPKPSVPIAGPVATSSAVAAPKVAPAPKPAPSPAPTPRRDLASAFSDFRPPVDEQRDVAMVDISKLPSRAKKLAPIDERGPIPDAPTGTKRIATADPATAIAGKKAVDAKAGKAAKVADKVIKPVVPSHPSRIWVQLGVGRDKGALGFDWRKLGKTQADLFKARRPWTTPWGQTNRLLVGPFETQAAAQTFLKDARKKDGDAFVWTSPAGQAVEPLAGK